MPHGPADGREGCGRTPNWSSGRAPRSEPDGEIMLDCWMAWTERYTIEMAEMLEPYRVYWMEEVPPAARLRRLRPAERKAIKSTRIVTGEHEYDRYGFRYLLEHQAPRSGSPTSTGAAA